MKNLLGVEVIHKKRGKGNIINIKKSGANKYLFIEFQDGKKDWFNMGKVKFKLNETVQPKVEEIAKENIECKNNIALKISSIDIIDDKVNAEMLEGKQGILPIDISEKGSIAILTGKSPKGKESQRMIFAIGIISDISEREITVDKKYSVNLNPQEAEKIMFWNFHKNTNAKTTAGLIRWGTASSRNLTDIETAQILKAIAEIKTDAIEFFNYYCSLKNINNSDIPASDGGLQLQVD